MPLNTWQRASVINSYPRECNTMYAAPITFPRIELVTFGCPCCPQPILVHPSHCCCVNKQIIAPQIPRIQQNSKKIPEKSTPSQTLINPEVIKINQEESQKINLDDHSVVEKSKVPVFKRDAYIYHDVKIIKPLLSYLLKLFKDQPITSEDIQLSVHETKLLFAFLSKKYFFLRTYKSSNKASKRLDDGASDPSRPAHHYTKRADNQAQGRAAEACAELGL